MGITKVYTNTGIGSSTGGSSTGSGGTPVDDANLVTSVTITDTDTDGGNDKIVVNYKDGHKDTLVLNAEGKVKVNSTSTLAYLEDIVDGTTISINGSNRLESIGGTDTSKQVDKIELIGDTIKQTYGDGHTDNIQLPAHNDVVTTLTYDSGTKTLSYKDEEGTVTTIDLTQTQARVASMSLNNKVLSLIRDDNSKIDIDLSGITHEHSNKTVLDKLGDSNDILTYNNSPVGRLGLRGEPVNNTSELRALTTREYEIRKVLDTNREYVFVKTANLTSEEDNNSNNLSDNDNTGKWILQELPLTIPSDIEDGDLLKYSQADNKMVKHKPSPYKAWRVVSTHKGHIQINDGSTIDLVTNHDMQSPSEGRVFFNFRDNNDSINRILSEASFTLSTFRSIGEAYFWGYDNAYVRIKIKNASTGEVSISASHRGVTYINSRLEILDD